MECATLHLSPGLSSQPNYHRWPIWNSRASRHHGTPWASSNTSSNNNPCKDPKAHGQLDAKPTGIMSPMNIICTDIMDSMNIILTDIMDRMASLDSTDFMDSTDIISTDSMDRVALALLPSLCMLTDAVEAKVCHPVPPHNVDLALDPHLHEAPLQLPSWQRGLDLNLVQMRQHNLSVGELALIMRPVKHWLDSKPEQVLLVSELQLPGLGPPHSLDALCCEHRSSPWWRRNAASAHAHKLSILSQQVHGILCWELARHGCGPQGLQGPHKAADIKDLTWLRK